MKSNNPSNDLVIRFYSSTVDIGGRYSVMTSNVIPQVNSIRLYEETIDHVRLNHGHEFPVDLPSIVTAVGRAIMDPTHVEASYENSYVFVDRRSTNASGDPLRVPVKILTGLSGRVKTFYFAETEKTPLLIYKRSDEQG